MNDEKQKLLEHRRQLCDARLEMQTYLDSLPSDHWHMMGGLNTISIYDKQIADVQAKLDVFDICPIS